MYEVEVKVEAKWIGEESQKYLDFLTITPLVVPGLLLSSSLSNSPNNGLYSPSIYCHDQL